MKIFLTGATGFIGKAILAEVTTEGHEVYALARDLSRFYPVIEQLPSSLQQRIKPIVGDLSLPRLGMSSADYELLTDVDLIIHAGGPMNIRLNAAEAERAFLLPSKELAELAVQIHRNRRLKQFIHIVGYMSPYNEENGLTDQDAALRHAPPYERSKFQADAYLRKALHKHAIPLSTVNPSTVIGDSVTGKTEQLGGLGILVDAVRRNLMPLVPGGDKHWLPMVHLDHVASFVANLVRTDDIASNTYYLLDPRSDSPTMSALISTIATELRTMRPIGSVPPAMLKTALGAAIGERLGIPSESMNFIVNRDFSVSSKTTIEDMHGKRTSLTKDTFPFVIADLDFRLSHPAFTASEGFMQKRRSKIITLERTCEGPPLVLLHGTFSSADRLMPIAERLNGHRSILVDFPGFGRSPIPRGSSLIEDCVEAVTELILELEEPVMLAGHSFGGLIAAMVMERIEPRIRKLVLLQPVLHPVSTKYRYATITDKILKCINPYSIESELRKGGDFTNGGEGMERYVEAMIRDLKSSRIRHTNAWAMSLLTQTSSFRLRPEIWNPDKVRLLRGERDGEFRLPAPFRRFDIDSLPYGHQFPIEAPLLVADWFKSSIFS
ncbi:MxaA domain-containing protein [Brevibacillus reuszeri]|nr:alpha/beta fold hydrolase [Brevibacillus reuszeri]MED1860780.1 alpha/beta fold hydrolase [Brevibacillus reuszeri]GED70449.1 MxaA domain-containing protein [Brevibacillus reuszeri]